MSFVGREPRARAADALAIAIVLLSTARSPHAFAFASQDAKVDLSAVASRAFQDAKVETRALWVLRTSLTTPDHIAALVRSARDNGFNTLLVQVRGRGDAYYRGSVEPRPAE